MAGPKGDTMGEAVHIGDILKPIKAKYEAELRKVQKGKKHDTIGKDEGQVEGLEESRR